MVHAGQFVVGVGHEPRCRGRDNLHCPGRGREHHLREVAVLGELDVYSVADI
jgi:hypothetical protein